MFSATINFFIIIITCFTNFKNLFHKVLFLCAFMFLKWGEIFSMQHVAFEIYK